MEGVPFALSLTNIGADMAARPGVQAVVDLHVCSLSSRRLPLSAHVVLHDVERWASVLADLRSRCNNATASTPLTLQPEVAAYERNEAVRDSYRV